MVILPINSVINPLLYDDVVTKTIGAPVRYLSFRISNSTVFQSIRQIGFPEPTVGIELQQRNTDVGNTAGTTQEREREATQ